MIKFIRSLFAKEPEEKIRLKIKDGKLVGYYLPAHIVNGPTYPMIRQQLFCYRVKLNGDQLGRLGYQPFLL